MKRFAQTLLVISLATAGATAFAATPGYPAEINNEIPMSTIFPDMVTYKQEHRDTVASQPEIAYPAEINNEIPLSAEFPNMVTYKQEHRDSIASQPEIANPAEIDNEIPMVAVFPNMTTYADLHRDDSSVAQSNGSVDAYAGVAR